MYVGGKVARTITKVETVRSVNIKGVLSRRFFYSVYVPFGQ